MLGMQTVGLKIGMQNRQTNKSRDFDRDLRLSAIKFHIIFLIKVLQKKCYLLRVVTRFFAKMASKC